MKIAKSIAGILVALWAIHWTYVQILGTDSVVYQGEEIRFSRKYVDYDTYKNDTDNILASELPRVERLMTEAKIGPGFKDWSSFVDAEFKIKFPGYGCGLGFKVVAAERNFVVSSVEIPTRIPEQKLRYFVLEKLSDGTLKLVDDFVAGGHQEISEVHQIDGRLVYYGQKKEIVRETTL